MKNTTANLSLLTTVSVAALVASNVTARKLVSIGTAVIPGGVICYAITFLITDVIGEIWGKPTANRVVWLSFIAQLTVSGLIFVTQILPPANTEIQTAYELILGNSIIFTLAWLCSYIVSQFLDVLIFHKVKEKFGQKKWLRNNISTMTSQVVDSAIYLSIAFGFGCGWFWNGNALILLNMFVTHYAVKVVLAVLDTPFFYLMTRRRDDKKEI